MTAENKKTSTRILPIIVFAQFCCTSLWFAGNAVMTDLLKVFKLDPSALGHLTSSVQFGFILGTLVFAFLSLADRFSPSKIFFICALFGSLINLGVIAEVNSMSSLLLLRFFTGFSLAGIYPVGMKLAADHFNKGLGTSLGYLVGALVLGTAFPHLLNTFTSNTLPWKLVIYTTSALALLGGTSILLFVPDGPYRAQKSKQDFSAFFTVFQKKEFRAAAFGYFGHMWELYTFWAFVPVVLAAYNSYSGEAINISLWSFLILGIGSFSCVAGGYISQKSGPKKTAATALLLSGLSCFLSPLVFFFASKIIMITFLLFWGIMVVADSPLFSTLVAQNAPAQSRGTALTIVNCVGFSITIVSLQAINLLLPNISIFYLLVLLGVGPLFGLWSLFKKNSAPSSE